VTQAARQLPTPADLPPAAQRRLETLPPELREIVAACYPTDEREQQARRDEEERQRARIKREHQELLALADKAEAGELGPDVQEAALEILAGSNGGRSSFNLSTLRTAIRRLR
jgi:hypothetical protein